MNKNIGIIGTGRLGLSFALLCENKGYNIIGCDTRTGYVNSLNNRSFTTVEPDIDSMLQKATNFTATTDHTIVYSNCDLIFAFVPTPSLPDGSYHHQAIEHIVKDITNLHDSGISMEGKVLVIGCTVMPGYTDTVQERLSVLGIDVAYNPEFIAQGDIVQGLRYADMVLMGVNKESTYHALSGVYRTIMGITPNIRRMSPKAAELTKISINCFLTTKIAFANMIGDIAISSGIESEVDNILKAIGDDSRIGQKFLRYGYGYSGVCLPRDNRALATHAHTVGVVPLISVATDTINQQHAKFIKALYMSRNPDKRIPFLFTQLSYKKGVDILTESAPYQLCKDLLHEGYRVDVTESPLVIKQCIYDLQTMGGYGDRVTYGTVKEGFKIEL